MSHTGAELCCRWVHAVEKGWGDIPEGIGMQGDVSVQNCVVWLEAYDRGGGQGLIWGCWCREPGRHCDFSNSWPELLGRPPASIPSLLHSWAC